MIDLARLTSGDPPIVLAASGRPFLGLAHDSRVIQEHSLPYRTIAYYAWIGNRLLDSVGKLQMTKDIPYYSFAVLFKNALRPSLIVAAVILTPDRDGTVTVEHACNSFDWTLFDNRPIRALRHEDY